jgi:gamma-glutamylcyclotransferase (GGCT)/AIG2-like uncharacterized protein YtfP
LEETSRLFVYGTLLLDDVMNTLLDRIPHYQDATAPDWRVVRLPQRVYPGLIPGEGDARGKIFTDLTPAEWNTLDTFEDPAYTLTPVRAMPLSISGSCEVEGSSACRLVRAVVGG